MACPRNSITYNGSLCACAPGYLLNQTSKSCDLFRANASISTSSGVDYYSLSFPESVLAFDSIKKFTQSQAVFLEATVVILLCWFFFCFFMRFMKLGDGNTLWFQIRWWISRLDVCFATRHWLEDQKVVRKRKTELGGTLSIASWILFSGLFSALLYQIIAKRTIEVHNVKATNAPDLLSFSNDMEFNITTISSMSCANLRNLGNLVSGNPGLVDYKTTPLSKFVNFSCFNTSHGPTISLRCNSCQLNQDSIFISWEFVDLPNSPATAVGFQFNLSSKPHASKKHMSFVSGILGNGSSSDVRPVTFRGTDSNLLQFNLFPRMYHHLHDLRLIQPLFHDFVPGSYFSEASQLQESLQNSRGLINTTVYLNFLSAYVIEVDKQSIMGPVSFLAEVGGLYCISVGIFYYFLVQFEYRAKRLRNEDCILREIRNRCKAKKRWDKVRKYVRYRWACKALDEDDNYKNGTNCTGCLHRSSGSLHSKTSRRHHSMATTGFNQKTNLSSEENTTSEVGQVQLMKTYTVDDGKQHTIGSDVGNTSQPKMYSVNGGETIPPPPVLEFEAGAEICIADVQKHLMHLYNYNVMMRENLVATQSLLNSLANKSSYAT
ncbi:hypothetical protein SAY86_029728 [Trapa natans]|uniref:Transmembrane protein n=1 Tax=Trapa natans TaxID=22666 RepID=A0AAN7RC68_TRANT|nr:hypothetical protein SAY86_029728 [Trapa natans]